MDNCQKYLDALHNIVTIRQTYSEACLKSFSEHIKTKVDLQKCKIKTEDKQLAEPRPLTDTQKGLLKNLKGSSNNLNKLQLLSKQLDNLSEVYDFVNDKKNYLNYDMLN